jgi:hypothetical protein
VSRAFGFEREKPGVLRHRDEEVEESLGGWRSHAMRIGGDEGWPLRD